MWWAAAPQGYWPADQKRIDEIEALFEGDHGDRRQEIVFIGVNMNKDKITEDLNSCLISGEDFKKGQDHWDLMHNPFVPALSE